MSEAGIVISLAGPRYTREQLIELSKSPLCVRPIGMKSNDDWLGPPVVLQQHNRKSSFLRSDVERGEEELIRKQSGKEDTSFRSKHDEIVLGPPKISFGSASSGTRNESEVEETTTPKTGNIFQRFDRPNVNHLNSAPVKVSNNRYGRNSSTSVSRKGLKDDETDERDNFIRGNRKFYGSEESDKFRRGGRESSDSSFMKERRMKDSTSGINRREECSWRDRDDRERTDRRDTFTRDSRQKFNERTPEWMDTADSDGVHFNSDFANAVSNSSLTEGLNLSKKKTEHSQAHSIEEFQAWKERMKAADNGRKNAKEDDSALSEESSFEKMTEISEQRNIYAGNDVDRFFGMFNSSLSISEVKELSSSLDSGKSKSSTDGPRSSRFSSFFRTDQSPSLPINTLGEKSDVIASTSIAEQSTRPFSMGGDNSNDKEAFKRIIAMLGNKSSRSSSSSTPVTSDGHDTSVTMNVNPGESQSLQQIPSSTPGVTQNIASVTGTTQPTKDSNNAEFLMGLMRQSRSKTSNSPLAYGHEKSEPSLYQRNSLGGNDKSISPVFGSQLDNFSDRDGQMDAKARMMRNNNVQAVRNPQWQGNVPQNLPAIHTNRSNMPPIPMMEPQRVSIMSPPSGIANSTNAKFDTKAPQESHGTQMVAPQGLSASGPPSQPNGILPPFVPGMVPPPGVNLPPLPPGPLPPNFPFFGMQGPPPPLPPGFPPPQFQHNMNVGPMQGNMGPAGSAIPPFPGPPPPGLMFNGPRPQTFEEDYYTKNSSSEIPH
ncbi:hypothetical protein V1511DRAFT_512891 [Dipodascopsis uninucleata]